MPRTYGSTQYIEDESLKYFTAEIIALDYKKTKKINQEQAAKHFTINLDTKNSR